MDSDGLVIGIDIGGTFTDLVALDLATREVVSHKELTTPDDPNRGVGVGLDALFARHGLAREAVHEQMLAARHERDEEDLADDAED